MGDKINFIKWQLLARLCKGNIYERLKESLKKDLIDTDPFYYIYWMDLNKNFIEKYLFGTFNTTNSDYLKFINWLEQNYGKEDILEFNINDCIIKIPKPLFHDYKCFKAEFLDIIMPSLVKADKRNQPFLEGPYEYQNVNITEGDTVFDLGANFGLFSSLASSRNCNVHAFEPTYQVYRDYLIKLSQISPNIHIYNKAVSNITGTSLFNIYENKYSCNCLQEVDTNSKKETIKVETISIDDFVSQNKLNSVDFIKADIEGAERLMLRGAKNTLKEFAPNLAICYYHKLDDLKVLKKLIIEANPKYEIDVKYKKIYAYVPSKR